MGLKYFNIKQAYSPAYILVIILLSLLAVFLLYGVFNDYITSIFPWIMIENGGDAQYAQFSIDFWQTYFVIAFVISLIIFVIVNAQRREE
jgi:prepilin signal peptidase PulO-like enzyme (type II secretory pathway)